MYTLIWLTKMILSHLITDFILQPGKWVTERKKHHFASKYLYLHGAVTSLLTCLFIGWQYWGIALIILLTHILIDGWKSYQKDKVIYFLIDQLLHLLVILLCWYIVFFDKTAINNAWKTINEQPDLWIIGTGFTFLSFPAGILIGQLTNKWRIQLPNPEGLANAGKWIGIIERCIILVFVLINQYEAIGLLIAAKGIVRFNENNRPEIKTEYLLIGTLISIALALGTGLVVKLLMGIGF